MRRRRRSVSVRAVLAALVLVLGAAAVARAGGANAPATPTATAPSVRDAPGYVPLHDPDSLDDVLGYRRNAPKVKMEFHGGARSLDELGRSICHALHTAKPDSMLALCVRSDEFRVILWPEFPQSRPATGAHWQDAWFFQVTRNRKGCGLAMTDWGGHDYKYVGISCDSTLQYRNFKLYSRLKIAVVPEGADTVRWDFVKAIVSRKGSFKILSMRD